MSCLCERCENQPAMKIVAIPDRPAEALCIDCYQAAGRRLADERKALQS